MLALAWYISREVNPPPSRDFFERYTFTPWELDVPFEDITLRAADGLTLHAWLLPRPGVDSLVIGCHGHVGAKPDLLGIGSGLWRAGHNVLLFDFRGRGESDPWPNTLASPAEVGDLLTMVAYARERLPTARIGIVGFSMGAAVALQAAAQQPALAAIVADSSFTTATEEVDYRIRQYAGGASAPLLALTEAVIERRYGYRLREVSPLAAIRQLGPRPLLLIHGAEDSIIPAAHTQRLFEAAHEPKELWIYNGAEHCGAYFADRSGYVARVRAFFDRHLLGC